MRKFLNIAGIVVLYTVGFIAEILLAALKEELGIWTHVGLVITGTIIAISDLLIIKLIKVKHPFISKLLLGHALLATVGQGILLLYVVFWGPLF